MLKNQECYDHMLPPEEVEEPMAVVEISTANISEKDSFTADDLNKRIEWFVEYLYESELDHPIYLNGVEWKGQTITTEGIQEL